MSRPATRRRKPAAEPRRESRLTPRTALAWALAGVLLASTVVGWIPQWLAAWVLVTSLWTFAFYWRDKRAATRADQPTPERTLQLLALAGGWPGALFAQALLRHKNRKVRFQQVFWMCVVANVASVLVLLRGAAIPH